MTMNLKNIILPSLLLGAAMVATTSCGDFLEQDSEQVIYADKGHLGSASDTIYSVTGIMNKMQTLADRTILLGELRGDLMDVNSNTSAELREIANFNISDDNKYNSPRDYYAVINNCNYFIAKVDTTMRNNRNEHIFLKEYAAVKAFRAWTYLQLVMNYGSVPFVTTPILTKEEGDRKYETKDIREVCEYLINDIAPLAEVEIPNYGSIRNTDSRLFFFPIYVLLGDLNLWAGHYKEAALAYYKYLSTRNGSNSAYPIGTNATQWFNKSGRWTTVRDSWTSSSFYSETKDSYSELITMIPGDSIQAEGNYSLLRDIFNSSDNNNYKVQALPSKRIQEISLAQKYCDLSSSNTPIYAPEGLNFMRSGDLRFASSWISTAMGFSVRVDGKQIEDYSVLSKYSSRNVHMYRRTMVYLRLAEALNRAGYPIFAFKILSSGVNNKVIEEEIIPNYSADSTWLRQFDFPNLKYVLRTTNGLSSENTIGIHSRGCGWTEYNEFYTLPDDSTITDSIARRDYQINKVEDLIMDEEALEFAFEGHRFYDLMRVALRRNDPSYLANKVYERRGKNNVEEMKALIKSNLTDTRTWYLNWNDKIGLGY